MQTKTEQKQQEDISVTIETEITETKAPDGGWGWFVVFGCLCLRLIVGGIQRSSGLFYVKFLDKFEGTATETAWVTALAMTVRLLIGPVVSVLCNRFSRRKLSFFGAAVYAIGLHITAYAQSLPYLYFSYGIVSGFGRAFVLTPCTMVLGEYFDKRRSLAFGLASAGFGIGGFAITPLIEIIFQYYGFTGTFILLSGFACNLFICVSFFRSVSSYLKELEIKNRRKSIYSNGTNGKDVIENGENAFTSMISSTGSVHLIKNNSLKDETLKTLNEDHTCAEDRLVEKPNGTTGDEDTDDDAKDKMNKKDKKKLFSFSVLKDVRFMTLCIATFIFSLPSTGLFLPALVKSRGHTDIEAAYLLSIIAGCDTVSRVASGIILDLKQIRSYRPIVYNFVSFAQCLALFIIPSLRHFSQFVVICCVHGLVMGVKAAQRNVILVDILGVDKLSSSFAMLLGFQGIGTLIGPPLAGLLKDTYGKYDYSFYFGGSAIFLGSTILLCGNLRNLYNNRKTKKTNS